MSIFDFLKKDKAPPRTEIARSESSVIYSAGDFQKYNPDDLIGRRGYSIYKRMMQDEQVKAAVRFKRDAITSRDYQFVLDADRYGLSEEEAQRRIDFMYFMIEEMSGSWNDALNGIMSAMYNGFSMTEKVYKDLEYEGKTWWGIDKLKLRPFDTFYFKTDEFGNVQSLKQEFDGKKYDLDPARFLHFVMNPDIDEHYGQSEIREAYRAWFSKGTIIKFRNMWLERHAGGFRWAQLAEGKTVQANTREHNDLMKLVNSISHSAGLIVPNYIELNSEYPANTEGFRQAIEDYNIDISRALLVPNLMGVTPSGQTGSYSQSDTQIDAFMWTLDADTMRLEDTLNEQLFKELGQINFGSGWPKLKFKPISGKKKFEVISQWKELVTSGAVRATETDESHLRELLEFPAPTEDEAKTAVDPATALNGAQVTSMVQVITQVTQGLMPKDTAIQILAAAFPINEEQAMRILEGVKEGSAPPQTPPQAPPLPSQPEDDEPQAEQTPEEQAEDETILGRGLVSVSAFSRARKRVNFAAIDKTSEDAIDQNAAAMGEIVADIIKQVSGDAKTDYPETVELKVDSKLKTKLNKSVSSALRDGYDIGIKNAEQEVSKAKKKDYSRTVDRNRLDFIADDYFKLESFRITGNLSSDVVSMIENEIINGVKYDKTWEEVETQIYKNAASSGMIPEDVAKAEIGEALGVTSPDARLRTIVRTSTFSAINEARNAYFTDPGLGDFVIGFEYSAILDSRTTTICRHLDETAGAHTKEWWEENSQYRPPNHYNCRSLLVPVTIIDEDDFVESDEPTMEPQKGFM